MKTTDMDSFRQALEGAMAVYGRTLSEAALTAWWHSMKGYDIDTFRGALSAHLKDATEGRFPPVPAHVITQIEKHGGGDGRPSGDEAWAIAINAQSEENSVVWNDEICGAFFVCKDVLDAGDKIGARRTFLDAYERRVNESRAKGNKPGWWASWGFDKDGREQAVDHAISQGWLPAAEKQRLLPELPREEDLPQISHSKARENVAQLKRLTLKKLDGAA